METFEEKKKQFAEALRQNPSDPMAAGMFCFPLDFPKAAQAASQWPNDPFVKSEIERLKEEEKNNFALPTKDQFAFELLTLARTTKDAKFASDLFKLYSDVCGHTGKTPAVNVNVDNRRVMLINETLPVDVWEQRAMEQQETIINAPTNH